MNALACVALFVAIYLVGDLESDVKVNIQMKQDVIGRGSAGDPRSPQGLVDHAVNGSAVPGSAASSNWLWTGSL